MISPHDSSAVGAAIIAGVGVGHWEGFEEACSRILTVQDLVEYDSASHQRYSEIFKINRRAYRSLEGLFSDLSEFAA